MDLLKVKDKVNPDMPCFANSVDPAQLASEAN